MATSRATYRAYLGRALGRSYYVSSATTAASANTNEIVDRSRTEHDDFWNGATSRISSQDVPVRGGAGVNTNRTPTIFLDRALTSIPAISTNYELLKTWSFTDTDAALDDALASMYPYFYDPVDDVATVVEVDGDIEYPLAATWKEITVIQREIAFSSPTRYGLLRAGYDYDIRQGPTADNIILRYLPTTGIKLRIFAKAIPTLGATDASTSIHPWQVVVPGAMHYLYAKGGNPDSGALSQRWEQEAQRALALFEKRKREFHINRPATDLAAPVIAVGR